MQINWEGLARFLGVAVEDVRTLPLDRASRAVDSAFLVKTQAPDQIKLAEEALRAWADPALPPRPWIIDCDGAIVDANEQVIDFLNLADLIVTSSEREAVLARSLLDMIEGLAQLRQAVLAKAGSPHEGTMLSPEALADDLAKLLERVRR